ncbi:MAG: anthranilate synthase component TrpG [Crocinitomicaceae bacterium]|nr:anthranilate synthase component TrpG [Crocinitomicaceae bacterium]
MKILVVDNFDSFTFNLVHYLEAFDCEVSVFRNNELEKADAGSFDKIVLSPGPGLPRESGGLMSLISDYYDKKPILGVCLGMQALAEFTGAELINLNHVKHGVSEKMTVSDPGKLFLNLPSEMQVGLYHSWAVNLQPESPWLGLARSESGVLMAIEHKDLPLFGVQFHPESILTENGKQIILNFLEA